VLVAESIFKIKKDSIYSIKLGEIIMKSAPFWQRLGWWRTVLELLLAGIILFMAIHYYYPVGPVMSWYSKIVYEVPVSKKIVALTYDDGPYPVDTVKILNLLDKYHIKATFFMIGRQMEQYPQVVKMVIERGHVIGNHTYTHPAKLETYPTARIIGELDRCEQVIERMTGKRAQLFRPPLGLVDSKIATVAREEGYHTILWTVCADHHDAPTPQLMAQRVLKVIRPGGIILIHDGRYPDRWRDVIATDIIVRSLLKRGYHFVTVPQLLKQEVNKHF
jgi:Predicted xylanase/chitin deacetylase